MSDTVLFRGDGTYVRTGEIQKIDIQADPKSVVSHNPHGVSEKESSVGTTVSRARPGSFSLADLRRAAGKAASTVTKTVIPDKGEAKLSKLKQETRDFTATPDSGAKGSTEISNVDPIEKEEHDAKAKVSEVPADAKSRKQAGTKAKAAKPPKTATEKTEQKNVQKSTADSEESVTPVVEVQKANDVPKTELEHEPSSAVGIGEAPAISAIELDTETSASLTDWPSVEKEEEDAESGPANQDAPVQEVQAVKVITAEYSGNGFTLTTYENFKQQLALDDNAFMSWCVRCISVSAKYTGNLFYPEFNKDLRFYTFVADKDMVNAFVVVGCGDSLTVVRVNTKTLQHTDASSKAEVDGELVRLMGEVAIVYEERLHSARKV